VFLDAYVDRAPDAASTGLTADDIDQCDWIVVGHSHFDHLYGAERIARNTGARIVGSYETCRVMEHAGVPVDLRDRVAAGGRCCASRVGAVQVTDASKMLTIESFSAASKSSSRWSTERPSARAREKLAITPCWRARRAMASPRL
jgi:L-ascorbate metabolism protein UlaG (beta-lactamase superfamily)